MQVKLIGIGCGINQLTSEAWNAIQEAELIIGAKRMVESLPPIKAELKCAYLPEEIFSIIKSAAISSVCVLFSGDIGFYSGAKKLLPYLNDKDIEVICLPGISSLQMLAAKMGISWADWELCSAHGVDCDPIQIVMKGKANFFLTGGNQTPKTICEKLHAAGLGFLQAVVGENLSYSNEHIFRGTVEECSQRDFAPLSVLYTEAAPISQYGLCGIPDEEFIRSTIPMTKQEIRANVLSMMQLRANDVCWDIGAGSGSVSVEMALHCRNVWAVEKNPEALGLIEKNRQKFYAWNLHIIEGSAPDVLTSLPKPDKVFIGGSNGEIPAIIEKISEANPNAIICLTAIAIETLYQSIITLESYGYSVEVTQIAVSRTKEVHHLHMLLANNPIFIIKGARL